MVAERDLGRADLARHAVEHAAAQTRAQRAHRRAFGDHALHDGVYHRDVPAAKTPPFRPSRAFTAAWQSAAHEVAGRQRSSAAPAADRYELHLYETVAIRDGRHANNPWLQELPDPVTKITWGNYLVLAPSLARRLGVESGDVVRMGIPDAQIELPAYVQPGQSPGTVSIALGYGRQHAGKVAYGVGANAFPLVTSFDGLGYGFVGPQGSWTGRNPSDNTLAVGPDHVVQIVNTRMAIFTKRGARFGTTGNVLYGPVRTNTVFKGFGGACETDDNADAVVRYDQLANRWLIVMPIFRRGKRRPDQPAPWQASEHAYLSPPGIRRQPGPAATLFVPPPAPPRPPALGGPRERRGFSSRFRPPPQEDGPWAMCYAVSTSPDPLGSWYRYEFLRPLFADD